MTENLEVVATALEGTGGVHGAKSPPSMGVVHSVEFL